MGGLTMVGLVIVGIITGTVTSLIGASGVCVVVPALTMWLGMNSHMAIGTSLMVDVITSIVVAGGYFRHGNVRLQASLWITGGSILGAQLGSHWAGLIPDSSLSITFAIVLIISGLVTLRKKNGPQQWEHHRGLHITSKIGQASLLLMIGLGIGIISGLVGAGGGVMILLAIIFVLHYPIHQAVGTSTVIMAITAISSLLGYARQENVNWKAGALIAVGAVIAGLVGSRFANSINEKRLNVIVAGAFVALGCLMIGLRLAK
ncbi:sulfite exporter TauE/SafE family protein [uncultured Limosilactobacillus sp.]|uniref:sulfite exporter TauE/SafE family protein n=1 Tax=uncultured Limosilactobacillus sp. TaxID=2837629 RepID=UPI0025FC1F6F|nr:sulfite exporter TauE/SafE family protein [uncultured Limosilactobacillus sp.]